MSLSGALSNAVSGLNANARGTAVISANVANALNADYGKRTLNLSTDPNQSSGGVRVVSVTRFSDPILAHQKHAATSESASARVRADAAKSIEQLWGSVDTIDSVATKLTKFETSLSSAAADPSSETRLKIVAQSAEDLARSIRDAAKGIQTLRTQADASIATSVAEMNTSLQRLEELNKKVVLAKHLGQDTLTLLDQRNVELERLSNQVPIRVVDRDNGAIAVFTGRGSTLLDVNAVELSFQPQSPVLSHMTEANGLLSSLRINGDVVDGSSSGLLSGGELSAQFDFRNRTAPEAQQKLDAIARDMIERFSAGGPDTSLSATDAGAFTDNGTAFDPVDQIGIAERLQVNSALQSLSVDLRKWRDGIMSTTPGEAGDSSLLLALKSQLNVDIVPATSSLGTAARSLTYHVQNLTTTVAAERVRSDDQLTFAIQQLATVQENVASNGVNTDQEMQQLIELEKSYAANARVIRVVDEMLSELFGI